MSVTDNLGNRATTSVTVVLAPALWFAEFTGNRIGHITTAGTVTEFINGITANSFPLLICTGQ